MAGSAQDSSKGKPWEPHEDQLLKELQGKHGNKWTLIAKLMNCGRTGQQCVQRWRHKVNPDIVHSPWTPEEDELLLSLVEVHGTSWATISRHMPGRTDQQCLGRWRRRLDPAICRGDWTSEEDELLLTLHSELGNSWSRIAQRLSGAYHGRTSQQCRGRYFQLQAKEPIGRPASQSRTKKLSRKASTDSPSISSGEDQSLYDSDNNDNLPTDSSHEQQTDRAHGKPLAKAQTGNAMGKGVKQVDGMKKGKTHGNSACPGFARSSESYEDDWNGEDEGSIGDECDDEGISDEDYKPSCTPKPTSGKKGKSNSEKSKRSCGRQGQQTNSLLRKQGSGSTLHIKSADVKIQSPPKAVPQYSIANSTAAAHCMLGNTPNTTVARAAPATITTATTGRRQRRSSAKIAQDYDLDLDSLGTPGSADVTTSQRTAVTSQQRHAAKRQHAAGGGGGGVESVSCFTALPTVSAKTPSQLKMMAGVMMGMGVAVDPCGPQPPALPAAGAAHVASRLRLAIHGVSPTITGTPGNSAIAADLATPQTAMKATGPGCLPDALAGGAATGRKPDGKCTIRLKLPKHLLGPASSGSPANSSQGNNTNNKSSASGTVTNAAATSHHARNDCSAREVTADNAQHRWATTVSPSPTARSTSPDPTDDRSMPQHGSRAAACAVLDSGAGTHAVFSAGSVDDENEDDLMWGPDGTGNAADLGEASPDTPDSIVKMLQSPTGVTLTGPVDLGGLIGSSDPFSPSQMMMMPTNLAPTIFANTPSVAHNKVMSFGGAAHAPQATPSIAQRHQAGDYRTVDATPIVAINRAMSAHVQATPLATLPAPDCGNASSTMRMVKTSDIMCTPFHQMMQFTAIKTSAPAHNQTINSNAARNAHGMAMTMVPVNPYDAAQSGATKPRKHVNDPAPTASNLGAVKGVQHNNFSPFEPSISEWSMVEPEPWTFLQDSRKEFNRLQALMTGDETPVSNKARPPEDVSLTMNQATGQTVVQEKKLGPTSFSGLNIANTLHTTFNAALQGSAVKPHDYSSHHHPSDSQPYHTHHVNNDNANDNMSVKVARRVELCKAPGLDGNHVGAMASAIKPGNAAALPNVVSTPRSCHDVGRAKAGVASDEAFPVDNCENQAPGGVSDVHNNSGDNNHTVHTNMASAMKPPVSRTALFSNLNQPQQNQHQHNIKAGATEHKDRQSQDRVAAAVAALGNILATPTSNRNSVAGVVVGPGVAGGMVSPAPPCPGSVTSTLAQRRFDRTVMKPPPLRLMGIGGGAYGGEKPHHVNDTPMSSSLPSSIGNGENTLLQSARIASPAKTDRGGVAGAYNHHAQDIRKMDLSIKVFTSAAAPPVSSFATPRNKQVGFLMKDPSTAQNSHPCKHNNSAMGCTGNAQQESSVHTALDTSAAAGKDDPADSIMQIDEGSKGHGLNNSNVLPAAGSLAAALAAAERSPASTNFTAGPGAKVSKLKASSPSKKLRIGDCPSPVPSEQARASCLSRLASAASAGNSPGNASDGVAGKLQHARSDSIVSTPGKHQQHQQGGAHSKDGNASAGDRHAALTGRSSGTGNTSSGQASPVPGFPPAHGFLRRSVYTRGAQDSSLLAAFKHPSGHGQPPANNSIAVGLRAGATLSGVMDHGNAVGRASPGGLSPTVHSSSSRQCNDVPNRILLTSPMAKPPVFGAPLQSLASAAATAAAGESCGVSQQNRTSGNGPLGVLRASLQQRIEAAATHEKGALRHVTSASVVMGANAVSQNGGVLQKSSSNPMLFPASDGVGGHSPVMMKRDRTKHHSIDFRRSADCMAFNKIVAIEQQGNSTNGNLDTNVGSRSDEGGGGVYRAPKFVPFPSNLSKSEPAAPATILSLASSQPAVVGLGARQAVADLHVQARASADNLGRHARPGQADGSLPYTWLKGSGQELKRQHSSPVSAASAVAPGGEGRHQHRHIHNVGIDGGNTKLAVACDQPQRQHQQHGCVGVVFTADATLTRMHDTPFASQHAQHEPPSRDRAVESAARQDTREMPSVPSRVAQDGGHVPANAAGTDHDHDGDLTPDMRRMSSIRMEDATADNNIHNSTRQEPPQPPAHDIGNPVLQWRDGVAGRRLSEDVSMSPVASGVLLTDAADMDQGL